MVYIYRISVLDLDGCQHLLCISVFVVSWFDLRANLRPGFYAESSSGSLPVPFKNLKSHESQAVSEDLTGTLIYFP